MATFDECVEKLPPRQKWWCERVEEEAGTTDGDWSIFAAAANLLADLESGIIPKEYVRPTR